MNRNALLCALLLPDCSALAQGAHGCGRDEVPYLESGCEGPARYRCWDARVRPTPQEYCGCDGQTFSGSVPSQRWRAVGPCVRANPPRPPAPPSPEIARAPSAREVRFALVPQWLPGGMPGPRRQLLVSLDRSDRLVGVFDRCAAEAAATGELLAVRCTDRGGSHRVALTREGDALVVRRAAGASPPQEVVRVALPASAALRAREIDGG